MMRVRRLSRDRGILVVMWTKLKLAINGFSTGVFLTLFFIATAIGMNPWVFFVAFAITGILLISELTKSHD